MTAGPDGSYGSGGAAPTPTDRTDEDRTSLDDVVVPVEASVDEIVDDDDDSTDASNVESIPRTSRPFRGWGAAQERETPSIWSRFRNWLSGLFGRGSEQSTGDAAIVAAAPPTMSDEHPTPTGIGRPSYDDLDAPWGESYPVEEKLARRQSTERPSLEDFVAPWDGSYETDGEPITGEFSPPAKSSAEPTEAPWGEPFAAAPTSSEPPPFAEPVDADPLWDEPRVAASSIAPTEAIAHSDIESVWSPPAGDDTVDPVVDVAAEPPAKQGFFARLFGRKPKAPIVIEARAAEDWRGEEAESGREPAAADFADDIESARAPMADDFSAVESTVDVDVEVDVEVDAVVDAVVDVEVDAVVDVEVEALDEPITEFDAGEPMPEPAKRDGFFARLFGRKKAAEPMSEFPPTPLAAWQDEQAVEEDEAPFVGSSPATDHSADDAATLADLLGPMAAPDPDPEPSYEMPLVDETDAVEASGSVDAYDAIDASESARARIEEIQEAEVDDETDDIIVPLPDPEPKKPGFFSQLLRRVSRTQFIPKEAAVELPPLDAASMPIAAAADVAELEAPVEVLDEGALVEELSLVEEVTLVEAVATVDDTEIIAPAVASPDPDATQPFPAFRDARDDFRDPPAVTEAGETGRITEVVEVPAFDENVKTDEFEIVAGVPGDGDAGDAVAAEVEAPGFFGRLLGRKAPLVAGSTVEGAATPQTIAEALDAKAPFVLAKFRTFYNEIIRDKHQKSDVISGFATAILSAAAADMADPEFAAQLLSKRLSEMLELQAAESNWTGGDAVKYYPEAQYAMVALADETFATIDWPGRPSWHKYMLEPRMYQTRGADVEFFKRIDKLLRDPHPPKGARDLARVYLLVIASGFRGKFRVPGLRRPLAEYRRRLYEFSHRADPLELYARDRKVFPEAAANTLASRAVGRFTSAQKWIAAVVVLLVTYLLISHFAWTRLSADLRDVMSRIEASSTPPGSTP